MAVYVDDAAILFKGKPRYHLTADSLEELHAFTKQVGIKPCWFHRTARPHYDVTGPQRDAAIEAGARAVAAKELVTAAKKLNPRISMNEASCSKRTEARLDGSNLERVLHTLLPGQHGGRLTAERIGDILGAAGEPGHTLGPERARALLEQLVSQGQVMKAGRTYRLSGSEALLQAAARQGSLA